MNDLRIHVRRREAGYDFAWWHEAPRDGRLSTPTVRRARQAVGADERAALGSAIDLVAQSIGRLPGSPHGDEPLRRLGVLLHGRLIPPALANALAELPAGTALTWATHEDDLPWELIHDGRRFLSLRHPLTRVLVTADAVRPPSFEAAPQPATLVIANPTGELAYADAEAETLLEAYDAAGGVRCDLLARDQASTARVLEAMAAGAHAVIHFAGHARPGALRLADGWLEADAIADVLRGTPLVVLNACASARVPGGRDGAPPEAPADLSSSGSPAMPPGAPSGLVAAFLRGGAAGVVGQLWPVFDARAERIGPLLHRRLLEGETVAAAVQQARQAARNRSPEDAGWAAPVLWADAHLRPIPARARRQPGSVLVARFDPSATDAPPSMALLSSALSSAAGAIRQRGGRVLSRDDQGLRAVFGVPRTLEDDAARAMAAALAVRGTLAPLTAGIGVACGDLEVDGGREAGAPLVAGEVVARARRLAEASAEARLGSILVDQAATRLAGTAFQYAPCTTAGLHEGTRTLLSRRTQAGDAPVRPMEGRSAELGTLAGYWGAARAGRGCVVGIVGDAGIGKSHLLSAFRHSLAGVAHHWLLMRPAAGGDPPYAVVGRLLRGLLQLEGEPGAAPSAERVAQSLAKQLPSVEISSRLQALVAEVCGARGEEATPSEPDEARGLMVDLLRRLLALRAADAPVVLALEDLQRVDEASQIVMARVCDGVGRLPILALALTRAEQGGEPSTWSRSPDYRHLALAPLSDEAQRRLLARWLESSPDALPASLDPHLARTGGNPLFLEESVRALREQGRLLKEGGRWRLEGAEAPTGAPETLRRVMLARFDRLPGKVRHVLDAAAVAGDPVEPALLESVLGQPGEQALRELEARGFLRAQWESGEYRFYHDVVRETAAGALEPSRLRALHRRVARTLELRAQAASEGLDADLLERLARHWQAAVTEAESGVPAEGVDAPDVLRAARMLVDAGRLALRRLAARAALRRFEAATQLMAGEAPAGLDGVEVRTLILEACAGAGDARNRLGDFDAAIVEYERAMRLLEDMPQSDRARAADLARRLGRLHAWGGRYDEALRWLDRGQDLLGERLRAADRGVAAKLHVQRGVVHYWRGQMDEALAHVQRGLGIAEGTEHREALATGYNVLGAVTDARGERAAAEDAYERSLGLWRDLGDDYQAARVADNLGVTYFHRGRWADAAAAHERALNFLERIEDRDQASYARINLGNVALGRGDWDEALVLFHGAEVDATAVGNARIAALARLNQGLVELERPDLDGAEEHLEAAASTIAEHGLEDMAAEVCVAQGRLILRRGDPVAAEPLAREALRLAQAHALQLEEALARRLLGRVLAKDGPSEEALAHLRWSRATLAGLSQRHELGRTLVALAEALGQRSKDEARVEARAALEEAGRVFEALGARADLEALAGLRYGAA